MIDFLKEVFGFESLAKDGIKWLVYTLLAAIVLRIWRKVQGWNPDVKQERAFWILVIPMMFGLVALTSGLRGKTIGSDPDLRGKIHNFMIGKAGVITNTPLYTSITFAVGIVNNGAPSVAVNWRCEAILLSGHKLYSEAYPGKSTATIVASAPDNRNVEMPNDRYLPNAVGETPIESGAAKQGWVSFGFPKTNFDELNRPGVRYGVTFDDRRGNSQTIWVTNSPSSFPY